MVFIIKQLSESKITKFYLVLLKIVIKKSALFSQNGLIFKSKIFILKI